MENKNTNPPVTKSGLRITLEEIRAAYPMRAELATVGGRRIDTPGDIPIAPATDLIKIVSELPQASVHTCDRIYLLYVARDPQQEEQAADARNLYQEYVTVKRVSPTGKVAYSWECLGEFQPQVDLSGYVSRQDLDALVGTGHDADIIHQYGSIGAAITAIAEENNKQPGSTPQPAIALSAAYVGISFYDLIAGYDAAQFPLTDAVAKALDSSWKDARAYFENSRKSDSAYELPEYPADKTPKLILYFEEDNCAFNLICKGVTPYGFIFGSEIACFGNYTEWIFEYNAGETCVNAFRIHASQYGNGGAN